MFMKMKEKKYLKEHPLCVVCYRLGHYKKATRVWTQTNGGKEARCDEHCRGAN